MKLGTTGRLDLHKEGSIKVLETGPLTSFDEKVLVIPEGVEVICSDDSVELTEGEDKVIIVSGVLSGSLACVHHLTIFVRTGGICQIMASETYNSMLVERERKLIIYYEPGSNVDNNLLKASRHLKKEPAINVILPDEYCSLPIRVLCNFSEITDVDVITTSGNEVSNAMKHQKKVIANGGEVILNGKAWEYSEFLVEDGGSQ